MNIAIMGATGWIGSALTQEALQRGHAVTALVRAPEKLSQTGVIAQQFDALTSDITKAVEQADVVIASIGGRSLGNHDVVPSSAQRLLDHLPAHKPLLWVGGAGSLLIAENRVLADSADFPSEYLAEALAQRDALEVFRADQGSVNWTVISPAAQIFPGERTGQFRLGNDYLLVDAEGNSRISVEDYAVAVLDQAEQRLHPKQRISVAY